MFRKPAFTVIIVSLILLIYCILINTNAPLSMVYFIFTFSPFLLAWLVYTIIRFGIYKGKELEDEEEWRYQDKCRDELGMF